MHETWMRPEIPLAEWSGLTAEIPGLDLAAQAVYSRPQLAKIYRLLGTLESQLKRDDLPSGDISIIGTRLWRIITDLLSVEECLSRGEETPWCTYRWLVLGSSWMSAAREAYRYVNRHAEDRPHGAIAAAMSAVQYLRECALAYTRLDMELLRADATRAEIWSGIELTETSAE